MQSLAHISGRGCVVEKALFDYLQVVERGFLLFSVAKSINSSSVSVITPLPATICCRECDSKRKRLHHGRTSFCRRTVADKVDGRGDEPLLRHGLSSDAGRLLLVLNRCQELFAMFVARQQIQKIMNNLHAGG